MKVSEDLKQAVKGICTEIGAGMCLIPTTEADHAHNGACERSISIARRYGEGSGLFQSAPRSTKLVTRAAQLKSLMEDSGYSRAEAKVLADAGFGEAEE